MMTYSIRNSEGKIISKTSKTSKIIMLQEVKDTGKTLGNKCT